MFVSMKGVKAQYHFLTLLVVSEFNEWRVLLRGADVSILGARQFSEAKAKEHAITLARNYVHEYKKEDLPVLDSIEWVPVGHDDWLVWHA
jgi:hypothetical protein